MQSSTPTFLLMEAARWVPTRMADALAFTKVENSLQSVRIIENPIGPSSRTSQRLPKHTHTSLAQTRASRYDTMPDKHPIHRPPNEANQTSLTKPLAWNSFGAPRRAAEALLGFNHRKAELFTVRNLCSPRRRFNRDHLHLSSITVVLT